MGISKAIFMVVFMKWETTFGSFISFVVFGAGHYLINTLATICIVSVVQERSGTWIPFCYGFFGVGAITSPIIIGVIGLDAYHVLAFANLTTSVLCSIYPTPSIEEQSKEGKKEK